MPQGRQSRLQLGVGTGLWRSLNQKEYSSNDYTQRLLLDEYLLVVTNHKRVLDLSDTVQSISQVALSQVAVRPRLCFYYSLIPKHS